MRRIVFAIIVVIVIAACSSSSKQLQNGHYEAALRKSAHKIRKKPSKFEEVDVFNEAYRVLYNRDNNRVMGLKKMGNPANWSKIHAIYSAMNSRQELARSLPAVGINFEEKKFYEEMEEAKNNATAYAYAKGEELLSKNDRFEAREAYKRFQEVKNYNANFKSVDQRLREAKFLGTTNVFFDIKDNTKVIAPKELMEELQNVYVDDMDAAWTNYDNYIDTNRLYHYTIILDLRVIDVSPEQLKETVAVETRKIEDGFSYELDDKGNVKKDSSGNDIKHVKYKEIRCEIRRFHQRKMAHLSGYLSYYDNAKNKLIKRDPIASDAIFEHYHAQANGNIEALSPESQKELGNRPLPFPPDAILVLQAGDVLKKATKDIIIANKNIVR